MTDSQKMLQTSVPHTIHRLRETDSTNNEAARHYDTATDGEVWVAEFQQKGRGQQSNSWESEAGKNLLFSIFFRPQKLKAVEQFRLSQVLSLGICDALHDEGMNAVIKWPNDIYVGKKKIVGLLIEQHIMGDYVMSAVAGIGLNVNQTVFRSAAPNPTSMSLETGRTFNLDTVLERVLKHVDKRYADLPAVSLKDNYLERLLGYDEWREYLADGLYFKGKIEDVLATGELVVALASGGKRNFIFKGISFCL